MIIRLIADIAGHEDSRVAGKTIELASYLLSIGLGVKETDRYQKDDQYRSPDGARVKTVFANLGTPPNIHTVNKRVNDLCQLIVSEHDPAKIQALMQELNCALKDASLYAQNKIVALSRTSPAQ
ncbi:MAG TPA: hypothetical protein VIW67_12280 [Terriglobales bacterium]